MPVKHPSMLSVIRSHDASVFPFYALTKELASLPLTSPESALEAQAQPVPVVAETIVATNSAASTPVAKRAENTVQRVDFALMPPGSTTLLVSGLFKVTGGVQALHSCNEPEFVSAYQAYMKAFAMVGGFDKLAERYLMNMVNGAILFRNQLGDNIRCALKAGDMAVEIDRKNDLKPGVALAFDDIVNPDKRAAMEVIRTQYAAVLQGARPLLRILVRASASFGQGEEVFPSQEFAEKEKGRGRVLATVPGKETAQAAFHGRKVANAIRTIDTWYEGAGKPIPAEPFGVDKFMATCLRSSKTDFYAYMTKLPELTEQLKAGTLTDEALYVTAVFIRGGVFSKKAD